MIHVSGEDSGVLLLHLECACGELSMGFPNDAAQQTTDHPTRKYALEDGWRETFDAGLVVYTCPACVKAEKETGKAGTNMAKQNGAEAKPKQLEIKVPIDKAVIELKRQKLFEVEQEIDKLKAKKREVSQDYTDKIKDRNEVRATLMEQIETQLQKVTAPVTERRDERRACILTVRADTGDVVDERPMSFEERQITVQEVIDRQADAAKTNNGAAEGESGKKKRGGGKGRKRAEARA